MRHETAMAAAFRKADEGVASHGRLRGLAVDLLRGSRHLSPSEQNGRFYDLVREDAELVHASTDEYLDMIRADMRGKNLLGNGHSLIDTQEGGAEPRQTDEGEAGHAPTADHFIGAPSPSPQHGRAGHGKSDTHGFGARPVVSYRPRERTSSERLAALKSRAETAQVIITVYDTYKLANGRAIGDIRMGELESMRLKSAADMSLIRLIQKHAVADPEAKVRDVVSMELLQRMIQKAAEYSDVA